MDGPRTESGKASFASPISVFSPFERDRLRHAGQQRNSAITWSGDIRGTWQVLKNQIPARLNFSVTGIPYRNTDTGGFFNESSVTVHLSSIFYVY